MKKKVLITAGPTFEPIDPVRFIGNRSTGKMGLEIVLEALKKNCEVKAIVGPNALSWPIHNSNLEYIKVETAQEMFEETSKWIDWYEIGIFAAAVADYRVKEISNQKIKKNDSELTITLVKNPDILAHFGRNKKDNQILIGFALETENEIKNAQNKLANKNLNAIVLNSLNDEGAGFQRSTNKITMIYPENRIEVYDLKSKDQVAEDILNAILKQD
jgi:phosphopantothenoylcysteine decarboxylase/phosphopantothenate--cysteine ligase